jgi:hypothetical protein
MEYKSVETKNLHTHLSTELNGKTIDFVTRVDCDEGFTIHFTDGTKLEAGWSSCYGRAGLNGELIECNGLCAMPSEPIKATLIGRDAGKSLGEPMSKLIRSGR